MNRREAIKALPLAAAIPAIAIGAEANSYGSGKSVTVSEAFRCLADAVNTDEGYRRAWVANIALLLNDAVIPEPEHTRKLRAEIGMTPQRLVDPRNLNDCNHFAERLLIHIFGEVHFVDVDCCNTACCES